MRHYIEYLNHNPQWVRKIRNDVNKLLVDREYIDFFMQICMQWSSHNNYISSNQKNNLWMSATFLETVFVTIQGIYWSWKMTNCYVCDNCQMSIFIQSSNVKECFFVFYRCQGSILVWKSGIRTMYIIYIFTKIIQFESINHELRLQIVKCRKLVSE